jgi:hypothetical protein
MARPPRNFGDNNRDGIDDDYDQKPGNSQESAEYSKRYDYGSSKEYTVYNLDRSEQIQIANINAQNEAAAQAAHNASVSAQRQVHFWPSVGKFIIPEENTWAAHAELVKDDRTGLHFNPGKYLFFDKIIAEKSGIRGLYDKNHPDYAQYEGLRTNLEVMRNDIIGIYLRDGSFDPGDERHVPKIKEIASTLGEALANDTSFNRMFSQSLSRDISNIEGVGAAEMYKYLLSKQRNRAPMQPLRDKLNEVLGLKPDAIWELPPLDDTPYSPENLSAPPPRQKNMMAEAAAATAVTPQLQPEITDPVQEVVNASDQAMQPVPKMPVEELEQVTKEASVEEARKILRALRNMEFGDRDISEWIDQGTPKVQANKVQTINKLVQIYDLQMQLAEARNPEVANDMFVQDGKYAADAIRLSVAEYALRNLPKDHPQAAKLEAYIFSMPEQAKMRQDQPLDRLLDNMSTGMERATGNQVYDRSPSDRLIAMSNRIQKSARKMRSVETLDPPARIESIALAHDILRRLKDMEESRKPIRQVIENSTANEKAAIAQKIDEMVDMYKNLVSEAATINPELMKDERIQEGVEAIQDFSHAVKLMAAKEMPNSVASAQQIGADATQDPQEWDKLHDRTIERIAQSMEGGLEQAAGAIEAQEQQDQDKAEEQAQEMSAELLSSNQAKRKKRAKRWSRSGAGGKRADKVSSDLSADDRSTGQGKYSEERLGSEQSSSRSNTMSTASAGKSNDRGNATDKLALNAKLADDVRSNDREPRTEAQANRRGENNSANVSGSNTNRESRSNRQSGARSGRNNRVNGTVEQLNGQSNRTDPNQRQDRNDPQRQGTGSNSMGNNATGNPAGGSGGGSRSAPTIPNMPAGLNAQALAAIKQEGNMLMDINRQARNIPTPDPNAPTVNETNTDRTNNRPRGNDRGV